MNSPDTLGANLDPVDRYILNQLIKIDKLQKHISLLKQSNDALKNELQILRENQQSEVINNDQS